MGVNFFLTLVSYAAFCVMYAHSLNCQSEASLEKAVSQCFQNAELKNNHLIGLVVILYSPPEDLCRNIKNYQAALECRENISEACAPVELRPYLSTRASVKRAIQTVCENMNAINFQCLKSAHSDLADCYGNKRPKKPVVNQFDVFCLYQVHVDCISEILPRCGCNTTEIYQEIYKQLNPPTCQPVNVNKPDCKDFSRSGNLHTMSLLYWLAIALFFTVSIV